MAAFPPSWSAFSRLTLSFSGRQKKFNVNQMAQESFAQG
jgi:hypothetical protein